jgi:ABC-type transport system substrate-binding protein
MAIMGDPHDENAPILQVRLGYNSEIVTADAAVDQMLPQLFSRSGFRTIDESFISLGDGSKGFHTTYQWRGENGEEQGILFAAIRGSKNLIILVESSKEKIQAHQDELFTVISSASFVDPQPFGIPREQALTLYFDDGPLLLDPAVAQETQTIRYITQIFSGLTSFNEDSLLTLELARSWDVSADGMVYTFTLRDDARFHDGRKVTSGDVKFSWERAVSLDSVSATARTYLGDIVGIEQFIDGSSTDISGVQVVDEATLQVTIDAPKAYFLSKLTHSSTFVVDENQVTAVEANSVPWWSTPNGTGPFKLTKWEPGRVMVLQANENFYRNPPVIPYIVYKLFGGVPRLMYENGEIDVASIYADELSIVKGVNYQFADELRQSSEFSVHYVGFRSDRAPFDDPLVRKAFLIALDRKTLVEDRIGDSGELAQGFLPPGHPSYNAKIPKIPFDSEEAKRLLSQSSYGTDGLPNLIYSAQGATRPSAIVSSLIEMWRTNLGANVEIQLADSDLYFYVLDLLDDNLFTYGWVADYLDPHNFLDVLFHSKSKNNIGGYKNDKLDKLLEDARTEQDPSVRLSLYRKAEMLIVEDAAAIPLYHGSNHVLVKPYVKNLILTPFGMLNFRSTLLNSNK